MKTVYPNSFLVILLFSALFTSAQTPVLNSYPASSRVIFLDFDGHTVSGTSWNSGGDIVCEGANLNTSQITTVFNRIAEDYRPFTVNVTTDSTKYWAAPADKRMRLILTTSSSWYGSSGGVAYINSFTWGDNTPCFVFTALHNYNTKNIAEAASHEIGHTLGLRHQSAYDAVCNKLSEYNGGKGSGEIGWAPIMGVGYYQNMTLWNYGANPFGCTNYQDDLSIITREANGISFRPDDHGNATSDASNVAFSNNSFMVGGLIEKPNDVDVWKFTTLAFGQIKLEALPFSIGSGNTGSNIDLEVELQNNAGATLGVYNAATTLNAVLDTMLVPGTYFLFVRGKGNIYAPNYASLGSYTLSAAFLSSSTLPVHKLQLKGASENRQHKLDWEIVADEKIITQTLEAGNTSTSFQPLAELNSYTRNYVYTPSHNNPMYYRIKLVMENGRYFYSNVITLRHNGNGKPYLVGNNTGGVLTVNSPANYQYSIYDMSGRLITRGKLTQGVNTLQPAFSSSGVYIIQYRNGTELHTEKFTKQ